LRFQQLSLQETNSPGLFETNISSIPKLTHVSPINVIGLRRAIADKVIAAEKYVC
jgi:hypothetical protein